MSARRPWILAGLLAAAAWPHAAQTPAFRSSVDVVRVDVLVTDGKRPVMGLKTTDFEVRDNDVLQRVDLIAFEELPINVILALDMSGSLEGGGLDRLRSASAAVMGALKKDDQAALVSFSHVVGLRQGLTTDRSLVQEALSRPQPAGHTSLVDATFAALMIGAADPGRSLLILFSDGLDTASWLQPATVLDAAKRSPVVVYGVSSGRMRKPPFAGELTSITGGRQFQVESTRNLSDVFLGVLQEFRQRYLVSYTPRGVSGPGWHRLSVKVKGRGVSVSARPGYLSGT